MTKLFRIALMAAALGMAATTLISCATQTQTQTQTQTHNTTDGARLRAASYDGIWTGTAKCLYDPGLWPDDSCNVDTRLEISGKVLHFRGTIHSKNGKDTSSEVDPALLPFSVMSTNAVAVLLDTADDEDGTWVETWALVMTLKDPDHMILHWTRVVNNVDLPASAKASKFSIVRMGELTRAGPDAK